MAISIQKFNEVAEVAKAKTNDKRWINAIDKAVAGVVSGTWIVTELADGIAVTTESGKTYFANGHCQCEAYRRGAPCKHRAAARLIELYNAAAGLAVVRAPRVTRSVERDYTGARFAVTRCNDWVI
jgi:hypothetical protein